MLQSSALSRNLPAAAVLLALLIIISVVLGGAQPIAVNLITTPWDKLVHGAIFALLAWAIGMASRLNGRPRLILAFFGTVLVGAVDEWHQMYLPGRQAGWPDFAADVVGSLTGVALLAMRRIIPK